MAVGTQCKPTFSLLALPINLGFISLNKTEDWESLWHAQAISPGLLFHAKNKWLILETSWNMSYSFSRLSPKSVRQLRTSTVHDEAKGGTSVNSLVYVDVICVIFYFIFFWMKPYLWRSQKKGPMCVFKMSLLCYNHIFCLGFDHIIILFPKKMCKTHNNNQ